MNLILSRWIYIRREIPSYLGVRMKSFIYSLSTRLVNLFIVLELNFSKVPQIIGCFTYTLYASESVNYISSTCCLYLAYNSSNYSSVKILSVARNLCPWNIYSVNIPRYSALAIFNNTMS